MNNHIKHMIGRVLCLSIFCISPNVSYGADDSSLFFTEYTASNSGLSFDIIRCILRDSKELVWIGTGKGLNRYNGNSFTNYYREELGVDSDDIICICPDENGNVWIGTDNGVTFYDYMQDRFIPWNGMGVTDTALNKPVSHIAIDKEGTVWISLNELGLVSFDPATRKFNRHFTEDFRETFPANIRTFFIDDNGDFYISLYYHGLWRSDGALQTLEPVEVEGFKPLDDITSIREGLHANTLIVQGIYNGTCEIDSEERTFVTYIPNDEGFRPRGVALSDTGILYSATSGGLNSYNIYTGSVTQVRIDVHNHIPLRDLTAVHIDRYDGVWVGVYASGLLYHTPSYKHFEQYDTVDGESLHGSFITNMADDGNGRMWIASDKKGLLWLDTKENELHSYNSPALPKSLFSILYDTEGYLWLGGEPGLYRLNIGTGETYRVERLFKSKVHRIIKTKDNSIVIGSTLGMTLYDREADTFTIVEDFRGVYITGIAEGGNGDFWVSTYAGGIYCYNMNEKRTIRRFSREAKDNFRIPVNLIHNVIRDNDGVIWACTQGAGVLRYDSRENRFVSFGESEKLNRSVAYSAVEDYNGRMWVATDSGLASFSYPQPNVQFHTRQDGLLDNMLLGYSGVMTDTGTIYFSSDNGFIGFNPREFRSGEHIPPRVITAFTVDNIVVKPGAGREGSPLSKHINETSKITLTHEQNSFGFCLSSPFLPGSQASRQFRYRLEGYDTEYIKLEGNSFQFTNVPAGSYNLSIEVFDDGSGRWSDAHAPIEIVVRHRFFETAFAFFIYVILSICLTMFAVWWYIARNRKRALRRQEEEKRVWETEALQEKITFFSNIIHEFKTPLTLISTPVNNILATQNISTEIQEDLTTIRDSADYLNTLSKELLDFVRIQRQGWILNLQPVDVIEQTKFLYSTFKDFGKTRNLKFHFQCDVEKLVIPVDKSGVIKILNNLFDNAVKYAETFVSLSVGLEADFMVLAITNDGPPIPQKYKDEIFKPFVSYGNRNSPYAQSFGIGLALAQALTRSHGGSLVLSDDDADTTFVLRLPLGKELIKDGERDEGVRSSLPDGEPGDPGRPLVLVVEDNEDLASYLIRKLSHDYRAVMATSAEMALDIVEQQDVNIILSDISLKYMSGIEMCGIITSDSKYSHIPVIMISALSSDEIRLKCMEAGASLYIEKPFDLNYMLESVKVIMQKRESLKSMLLADNTITDLQDFGLTNGDTEFIVKVNKLIMDNLGDTEFCIDDIAEELAMSKSTLLRKFKALLDTTPNDYIRIKRLNAAASMFSKGNNRINEVCYAVGFNTHSYFTKCFKHQFGLSPVDYLNEQNREK